MKPQRATTPPAPGYPDAAEFSRNHKLALGAVVIGAGLAIGGCRTRGAPQPPPSPAPSPPAATTQTADPSAKDSAADPVAPSPSTDNSRRILGVIAPPPAANPPTIDGVPPVVPKSADPKP